MRGRKNRNAFSYSCRTWSDTCARIGSPAAISLPPARESSQFADQVIFVSLPVSSDLGRATGVSLAGRRGEQVLVVVGPGLVVVLHRRQLRVGEDGQQLLQPATRARA